MLLLIVLFAAIIFIGYGAWEVLAPKNQTETNQNPDQMAGWKTYTNSHYGFSLKYPDNFFDVGHTPELYGAVQCNYQNVPENCPDINKLVGSLAGLPNQPGMKINTNGVDYCQYEIADAAAGHRYYTDYYVTVKNNMCFTIGVQTSETNCDNYLPLESGNTQQEQNYKQCVAKNAARGPTMSQIVSTFKFTK